MIEAVCDTNIISELARLSPNPGVVAWSMTVTHVRLSVVTLEEIHYGLAWKDNPRIRQWFETFLHQHCTVLPITAAIARLSGDLRGMLQAQGKTRSQADLLIAATASIHGLSLVTRNSKDFTGCGIGLVNPFSD